MALYSCRHLPSWSSLARTCGHYKTSTLFFPIFHFLFCFFALLPLKLIMRLRSICSSSALVQTRRKWRRGGGGETVAGERFAGGTTPFALCVKRSEVKTKVDNDEERGEGKGGVQGRWAWPAQISQCVETEASPAREGEGKVRLSSVTSQVSCWGMLFLLQHTHVAHAVVAAASMLH